MPRQWSSLSVEQSAIAKIDWRFVYLREHDLENMARIAICTLLHCILIASRVSIMINTSAAEGFF